MYYMIQAGIDQAGPGALLLNLDFCARDVIKKNVAQYKKVPGKCSLRKITDYGRYNHAYAHHNHKPFNSFQGDFS